MKTSVKAVAAGAAAGAAGTAALNATTYLDMAVRGRPASQVPTKTVGKAVDAAGIDLAGDAAESDDEQQAEKTAENRRSGLGSLMGFAAGIGAGAVYGIVRTRVPRLPLPAAGLAVGAAAMAAADGASVLAGTTDPRRWSASAWLSDIVPHAAYGLTTAAVFASIARRRLVPA